MTNQEIKNAIGNHNNDYLIRLTGIQCRDLKINFIAWLNTYTDGFKSLGDALGQFVAQYR